MVETQQVLNSSNEEESPKQEMSQSRRRRFKASNMSFEEMVDILKRADYDGKYGPYLNPNVRKAKIMTKVVKSDVQVVEPKSSHFTSDSAQRLIQEIMFCSRDLDLIKEKTKEIEQRLKNIIDALGRI
ncbi:hypothetical protein AB205_0075290 [Aquarana catesbeiana]|uniref:Uncharacterized protein n=1 Tax=Aquarana catesbeiana TaxID=8400 RepID=A0A2G9SF79_AQUCT|nr:hypothetical protein AB205_0075290 [Aquarana catesbeiana]